tara:strand:- start:2650 stop:2784 length:135 start_codon:yes stop_codon:yes gene_type:complete
MQMGVAAERLHAPLEGQVTVSCVTAGLSMEVRAKEDPYQTELAA